MTESSDALPRPSWRLCPKQISPRLPAPTSFVSGGGRDRAPTLRQRKDGKLELVIVNHDQNPDIPLTGELKLLG